MAEANVKAGGVFTYEHYRNGVLIDTWEVPNLVANEGLNHILDVTLHGSTPNTTWYVGIFKGNYTPQATDTAANIATNSTEATEYTQATRPEWVEAAAAAQSITNSASRAQFSINATVTLYGSFLISNNTKSGTLGVLMAATRFAASRSLISGDELYVTYTLNIASA